MPKREMLRPLLVLDLDETLLFADEIGLGREPDFTTARYVVYRRPHVTAFLRHVAKRYELAVWTSSGSEYAQEVCDNVFPADIAPTFVWSHLSCTMRRDHERDEWVQAKHLTKLRRRGYDLRRVLVVDDSPEKHRRNYGNLVRVEPFTGDPADVELPRLAAYLDAIAAAGDFRKLEKRFWRTQALVPVDFGA